MDVFRRQKFNEAMFAKNRTLAIRVGNYQSRDINEASFDYGYIKGDTYKPGGTCAGSAKIVFASVITSFNKLDKIYPEIGLLVDGTYEWVKMGEYFINDIEIDRNRKTTKLDLMDGMFKLNREHVTDLTYPAEIRNVIKEICLKAGIDLANENMDLASMNYRIEQIPKDKKMTFRDVLSLATQMLGMSCFFNREGKLEIKELTDSGIVITADSYFMHGLTKSEIEYQIAGITCKKDKETLTVGLRTGRSLELDNLFMSQSILDNLYHNIKDIRYYPFSLNYQGHLLLDVGQWVTIKTNTGETFKSPVLSQSFNFKGGLRGRISADSKAGNDAQYSYAGTITKKIEQFNEFEAQLQNQIEEADRGFDAKVDQIKKDFNDQIELAKAKAEENKKALSDEIDRRFHDFSPEGFDDAKRKAEEALRKVGANAVLVEEAKRIALDSTAKLEEFKSQATSAQTALSGDLDVLKQTVTSEVNQASEYRRTTDEALSRMTGQMNGFATKSEVKQDIDGLTQTFAKMKVGGRNYAEDYDFSRGLWHYTQGDNSSIDWKIINGEYNVKGTTKTWKQMQIFSKEGSQASGKSSTALLDLEIGDTYTLSFQGICYSGSPNVWVSLRANRTAPGNPEIMNGNFTLTSSWQTYQVTIPALTKPDNFDFWRIILGYSAIGHVAFRKVELTRSSTRIDAGPAPEDGKTDLVVAKSEFKKTAEGLSSKLATVETYVNQDGQRQEVLRRYTREESARQVNAVRELVTRDYVGKATYQEDVRGLERRFEAITDPQSGSIATQIANYKNSVDGRFADIASLIAGKANQTDFQRVIETSQLYERILGSTDNSVADNVARMALTSELFEVEVGKRFSNLNNLFYAPTKIPKYISSVATDTHLSRVGWGDHDGIRINYTDSMSGWLGVRFPLTKKFVKQGESLGYRIEIAVDKVPQDGRVLIQLLDNTTNLNMYYDFPIPITKTGNQVFTGYLDIPNTGELNEYSLRFTLTSPGNIVIHKPMIVDKRIIPNEFIDSTDYNNEYNRVTMSLMKDSFAVKALNSAGDIISQVNLNSNNALIEANKIRLKGRTLADEITAIDGYFKRLFVGDARIGTLNTDIIRSNSIAADKLIFDTALAKKLVASDVFTDQLAAKNAFINKLRSVVVSATLLEGYKGKIGGFQIGTHDKDPSTYWLTGTNQFAVGMSNGSTGWGQTSLWVNWGDNWESPGPYAWYVKRTGEMFCYNKAQFWNTPRIHGNLEVTGDIIYFSNRETNEGGYWIYSPSYKKIKKKNGYIYFYEFGDNASGDWIPLNKEISDRRYKHNIEDSKVSALEVIDRLKTYSYRKEYDGKIEDISCGIMAQDVQKYVPEAFYENPDGAYSYRAFELVPYLIKAIQELNQKLEKVNEGRN